MQGEIMYKNINFEQAKELIEKDKVILLDVRTEEEYITGHIPNSVLIPLDELEERLNELSELDTKIIVYCKSGTRSTIACEILVQAGYVDVYNLGGVVDWPYGLEM